MTDDIIKGNLLQFYRNKLTGTASTLISNIDLYDDRENMLVTNLQFIHDGFKENGILLEHFRMEVMAEIESKLISILTKKYEERLRFYDDIEELFAQVEKTNITGEE